MQELRKMFDRDDSFNDIGGHLAELKAECKDATLIKYSMLHTMARGNWRSMKREIVGNITTAVSGFVKNTTALVKELNATITIETLLKWLAL